MTVSFARFCQKAVRMSISLIGIVSPLTLLFNHLVGLPKGVIFVKTID